MIYKSFHSRTLAYGFTVIYFSLLNMILLYGAGMLLEGWMPTGIIRIFFVFPFIIGTALLMFWAHYKWIPKSEALNKEAKNVETYWPIVLLTVAAILVLLYAKYGDKIFQTGLPSFKPAIRPRHK